MATGDRDVGDLVPRVIRRFRHDRHAVARRLLQGAVDDRDAPAPRGRLADAPITIRCDCSSALVVLEPSRQRSRTTTSVASLPMWISRHDPGPVIARTLRGPSPVSEKLRLPRRSMLMLRVIGFVNSYGVARAGTSTPAWPSLTAVCMAHWKTSVQSAMSSAPAPATSRTLTNVMARPPRHDRTPAVYGEQRKVRVKRVLGVGLMGHETDRPACRSRIELGSRSEGSHGATRGGRRGPEPTAGAGAAGVRHPGAAGLQRARRVSAGGADRLLLERRRVGAGQVCPTPRRSRRWSLTRR